MGQKNKNQRKAGRMIKKLICKIFGRIRLLFAKTHVFIDHAENCGDLSVQVFYKKVGDKIVIVKERFLK